jgi:hypothetical protein
MTDTAVVVPGFGVVFPVFVIGALIFVVVPEPVAKGEPPLQPDRQSTMKAAHVGASEVRIQSPIFRNTNIKQVKNWFCRI